MIVFSLSFFFGFLVFIVMVFKFFLRYIFFCLSKILFLSRNIRERWRYSCFGVKWGSGVGVSLVLFVRFRRFGFRIWGFLYLKFFLFWEDFFFSFDKFLFILFKIFGYRVMFLVLIYFIGVGLVVYGGIIMLRSWGIE